MDIDDLLEKLFALRTKEDWKVISPCYCDIITNCVAEWARHQDYAKDLITLSTENGSLKAKVYIYEEIIAKSNFAPLITEKDRGDVENE